VGNGRPEAQQEHEGAQPCCQASSSKLTKVETKHADMLKAFHTNEIGANDGQSFCFDL
jgi:hypothetical protein